MSYINDALKKVQKEKDSRYQRYGNIVSDPVYHRTGRKKSRVIAGSVIVLILLALSVFMLLRYNISSGTGNDSIAIIKDAGDKTKVGSQKVRREKDEHRTLNVQHRMLNEKKKQGSEVGRQKAGDSDIASVEVKKVPEMPAGDVKRLYSNALNYQQNNNPAMAEKVYRKILSINPEFAKGLNNLGVICMDTNRNKEAADLFRKAIDLKADYVDPYYNLACLYSVSGNISKSLYYLTMAISINNSVKNWAKNDKDLEGLRMSEPYKKIME